MKTKIKYFIIFPVVVLVILIIYSFLFGKLFPYSPVIMGFSKNENPNTIIYIQYGAKYTNFTAIDSQVPFVEKYLNMEFKDKPRIFIFKDDKSYYHRSLTKARFCSHYNGDVIIAPWAIEEASRGEISIEIYMKHELTHSLIHQQKNLLKAMMFPGWLHEGVSMYVANQMGTTFYPSKEQTYQYIREGNFLDPHDFHTKKEDEAELNVKYRIGFLYSEFACIVDYLIEQYGKEKFLLYINKVINSNDSDKAFKDVYGLEFDQFIKNFKNIVMNN